VLALFAGFLFAFLTRLKKERDGLGFRMSEI
jgi:hypothetical protein